MKPDDAIQMIPEHLRSSAEAAIEAFAHAICSMAVRGYQPKELIEAAHQMVGRLDHTAMLGSSCEHMSHETQDALFAGLVGARMVFTPGRELAPTEPEPETTADHAHLFLLLASKRVGRIHMDDTRWATLRIRHSAESDETGEHYYHGG